MAKVIFTNPVRPAMPEAQLEPDLSIDLDARRVSGHLRLGDGGEWRRSVRFDFGLRDLDMSGAGGPLAKLQRGILLRAIATNLIPAGEIEAGD